MLMKKYMRIPNIDASDQLERMIRRIAYLRAERNRYDALLIESRGRHPTYRERIELERRHIADEIRAISRGCR